MPAISTPDGVSIHYDAIGDPDRPAMLLVQGLGAHLLGWPQDFCRRLADRGGYHVVRFDNRDVGLSQKFPAGGYTLTDMADDAAGLLDSLQIDAAHVVGQSMGGMIAQHLTLEHPSRVLSLALVYSTPSTDFIRGLDLLLQRLDGPRARSRAEAVELFVQNEAASASPRYPRDLVGLRELGGLMYDRCYDPDGVRRQTEVLQNAEDLSPFLAEVTAPTTIVHGSDDRLIDAGAATALHALVDSSTLAIHPGMGHELPRPLWDVIIDQICRNASTGAEPDGAACAEVRR